MAIMERAGSGTLDRIVELLGDEAESLLSFTCKGIPREQLTLPGPDHVDRVWSSSDRKPSVLVNLQRLFGSGRLANTGYLSILPVDQGVEHSAAASFAPSPAYFDPENIVRLAIEHVSRGPTVIAVTHRPALAAEADRVLVMRDGRLVEDGRHDSLMRAGTLYSRLWREGH